MEAKANGESAVNAAREDAKRQTEELWKEVHAARQSADDAKAEAWMKTVELQALRETGTDPDAPDGSSPRRRREETIEALRTRAADAEARALTLESQLAERVSETRSMTAELAKARSEAEKDRDAAATTRGALAGAETERAALVKKLRAAENGEDVLTRAVRNVLETLSFEKEVPKRSETSPSKEESETIPASEAKDVARGGGAVEEDPSALAARVERAAREAREKRAAAVERADALEARLRSAREQHEQLVRLHDDAMRRVVAAAPRRPRSEAREELAEIREEVLELRGPPGPPDARAARAARSPRRREEAAREGARADAAAAAEARAREALVGAEATARERERAREEALGRCREELTRAKEKA